MVLMRSKKRNGRKDADEQEFERFHDLARKLVSVSKKEIDRKAKAYERKKKAG